jgi:phosphoglycerate dehydrogenase-like enzyme
MPLWKDVMNIKVFMVGEAYKHKEELASQMKTKIDIAELPAEAAYCSDYDRQIAQDDVVISLKYKRSGGNRPVFRLLHVPGAGLDGIDPASLPDNCLLCNVYEHQVPISEYVMLSMLEWEIRFSKMCSDFTPETWSETYTHRVPHGELYRKTLCLVGFGGIAREIAKRARPFGMKIIAVDKFASDDNALADVLVKNENIGDIITEADYIVISCPLTDDTSGWINRDIIDMMKQSAVIINISRGPIISQKDIYEALAEKRIGGAVLDVWWHYPKTAGDKIQPADYPFHLLDNVFCTPHSCAWTRELTWRRYGVIADNIENLLAGRSLRNLISTRSLQ